MQRQMQIETGWCRKVLASLGMGKPAWAAPDIGALKEDTSESSKELAFKDPMDTDLAVSVLSRYGIHATFSDKYIGPSVTTYEFEIPVGTRFSAITRVRDDLARDLQCQSLRIIQSVEHSSRIALEVENIDRFGVSFRGLYKGIPESMCLPIIMGEDTRGQPVYEDLASMPHLLVAGQTGSGKSVFLSTTLLSLVCRMSPEKLQLLIVDPKKVEFVEFEGLPHLMEPIASCPADAISLVDRAVEEMERRFGLLRDVRVKKISDYNKTASEPLPYIVLLIDEYADLMLMGTPAQRREVEGKIVRIAQKARAVGIHMILATQKPLASVVTPLIKANLPARAAFSVTSGIDSRVILDECGAEVLGGQGDMIYRDPNARSEYARLRRIQASWISDEDVRLLFNRRR